MNIHEYQAKTMLSNFGVSIPRGGLAYSPEQAAYRARDIGGKLWAVKAQVHTGGRGKAGGVKICENEDEVLAAADAMFGKRLITDQTGPDGKMIYRVYVEGCVEIEREFYLAFVLDRAAERVTVVSSAAGGMEIEEIAADQPDSIVRTFIEPAVGMRDFQAREIAFNLGIPAPQISKAVEAILGSYRAFRNFDASMVEINPLALTRDGDIVALDAKMTFDSNALFRHAEISELRDKSQEDARESQAADRGLSYVGLEGRIGCIVNGAGLAMATMDMIELSDGKPANFLDIGGGATPERVAKAFKLVRSDDNVEAILVNIFAGINRCDWVAEGIVQTLQNDPVDVPVVVRLAGNNVDGGRQVLEQCGLPIIHAETLSEAAQRVVEAWTNSKQSDDKARAS